MSGARRSQPHVLRSITAVSACLAFGCASALAQPLSTAPAAIVRLLPMPADLPRGTLEQVSRDGTRVLMLLEDVAALRVRPVVLDAATGEVVLRARYAPTLLPPNAVLRDDGQSLVYRVGQTWMSFAAFVEPGSPLQQLHGSFVGTLVAAGHHDSPVAFVDATQRTLRLLPPVNAPGKSPLELTAACGKGAIGPVRTSADGRHLAYHRIVVTDTTFHSVPVIGDMITGEAVCPDATALPAAGLVPWLAVHIDATSRVIAATAILAHEPETWRGVVLDAASGALAFLPAVGPKTELRGMSHDARHFLLVGGSEPRDAFVYDRVAHLLTRVGAPADGSPGGLTGDGNVLLSGDGTTVLLQTTRGDLVTPAIAGADLKTYVIELDGDGDGLHDAWERTFGLDPTEAADASLDPDGDGLPSAAEYAAGTHPTATPVRYFAEGAHGTFFATTMALFNPGVAAVTAQVRFLGPDGTAAARPVALPARTPVQVRVEDMALPFTEFAMIVESPVPVVAERRMTWDRVSGYGSHVSSGAPTASLVWHFAEGATVSGMQTFFLLLNPGTVPAAVTIRYLLTDGTTHARRHTVPAGSRLTVWSNREGAPLDAAEFAAVVEADVPVVAERALYRDVPGRPFGAGSAATGVLSPSTTWTFAEGATGAFFDTYLLLANPGAHAVDVTIDYVATPALGASSPVVVTRTHTLTPASRRTIRVADEDVALSSTPLSLHLRATAPVVAERAMWWPGPAPATWQEGHVETGTIAGATAWAIADLPVEDAPGGWDTFLHVTATRSFFYATFQVSVDCDDGTRASRDVVLRYYRTTLWMREQFPQTVGRRCAATLLSLPSRVSGWPLTPLGLVPIAVEAATYAGHFTVGTVTSATALSAPVP